jgi:hypothetical protein
MPDHSDNVVIHPAAARTGWTHAAQFEALRQTVNQLDELSDKLLQIPPQSDWPAERWMIAATPFRMRLAGTRARLEGLGRMGPVGEHHPVRWMLDLNHARYKADGQLNAIMGCLQVLQRADASPAERGREAEVFACCRSELLTLLREIRRLIAWRFPAVLSGR